MRLRLDKLVLSAGLALAMVATTVPVGAATQTTEASSSEVAGWAINGSAATVTTTNKDAFVEAVTGSALKVNGTVTNSGISGVNGTITAITVTDAVEAEADIGSTDTGLTTNIKNEVTKNSLSKVKKITYTPATVVVKSTYVKNETVTLTVGEGKDVETSASLEDVNDKAATKVSSLITSIAAAGTDTDKNVETIQDPSTASEIEGGLTTVTLTEETKTVDVPVKSTYYLQTTYTVKTLPTGCTYDCIYDDNATSSDTYTVFKVTDDDGITSDETVDTTIVNTDEVMFSVTDFTSTYYIYKGVQSAAGALVFAQTTGNDTNETATVTSGNYTATISNAADNAELKAQVAEGDKYVSTFTIAVSKGGSPVDATASPLTFKIAVPQDLPAVAEGYTRTYKVIRAHDNNGTIEYTTLETSFDGTYITFESDVFSDFALVYSDVAAETTEATEEASNSTDGTTVADATNAATEAATEAAQGTGTTSTKASEKTGDNSMMPLFMTTLLLALCAGSLAIYKEKKTN